MKEVSEGVKADKCCRERMAGMTQQYYNLIENAERKKELDVSLLTKLSEFFEISIEEIVQLENS